MKTTKTFVDFDKSVLPKNLEPFFYKALEVLGFDRDYYLRTYKNRRIDDVIRRQVLCWILRRSPFNFSYTNIGRLLVKDHSTVIHSVKSVDNMLEYPNNYQNAVALWIRNILNSWINDLDSGSLINLNDYKNYSVDNLNIENLSDYLCKVASKVVESNNYENIIKSVFGSREGYFIHMLNRVSKTQNLPDVFSITNAHNLNTLINKIKEYGFNSKNTLVIINTDMPIDEIESAILKMLNVSVLKTNNTQDILKALKKYPVCVYLGNSMLLTAWVCGAITMELELTKTFKTYRGD